MGRRGSRRPCQIGCSWRGGSPIGYLQRLAYLQMIIIRICAGRTSVPDMQKKGAASGTPSPGSEPQGTEGLAIGAADEYGAHLLARRERQDQGIPLLEVVAGQ